MLTTRSIVAYPDLLLVIASAAVGLTFGRPLRWVGDHQGINVLLAVLVLATAVTVSTDALSRLSASWRQLAVTLGIGVLVLPAVSWLASRVVAAGSLRNGIMVVGIAPCEIASVATTGLAGGDAALAAAVLIGSTVLSVALAGPVLSLEAGHANVHPVHILVNLAIVVALPLATGLALRAWVGITEHWESAATWTATGALGGLVVVLVGGEILGRLPPDPDAAPGSGPPAMRTLQPLLPLLAVLLGAVGGFLGGLWGSLPGRTSGRPDRPRDEE